MLVDLIRDEGHEVSEAADGDLALMVLRGRPIDLMLVDLTLPTINGEFVVALMEARQLLSAHSRVVVITGSVDTALDRLEGLNVERIIYKPFGIQEILDALTPPHRDGRKLVSDGRE